ncbi:MAG: recombination regulator RecX [Actinobacteria bacterium]|nr:recombination regulator RecX [Actinomycetota bacterium]
MTTASRSSSFFDDLRDDEEGSQGRDAMERAGRFLTRRARSESEVRDALMRSGFEADVVERTVVKLKDLELLDDLAFAREWVQERGGGKGFGPRRLVAELNAKGVDRDTAEQALEEVGLDDEARAKEVAAGLVRKVASRPTRQQAMRLQQMLVARGFGFEDAATAARAVLPPEGWD